MDRDMAQGHGTITKLLAVERGQPTHNNPPAEQHSRVSEPTTHRRAVRGNTGYFADPDGVRWEIAWNPGEIGQLVLPD
jgi:hypothetical protein